MPTVFVIDDASEIRVALSRRLASAGHSVRSFESAEHLLEAHDEETPGCILLEAVLPGMSGLELQRTLIGSRLLRPIIFLTGRGDIETSGDAPGSQVDTRRTRLYEKHSRHISAIRRSTAASGKWT